MERREEGPTGEGEGLPPGEGGIEWGDFSGAGVVRRSEAFGNGGQTLTQQI